MKRRGRGEAEEGVGGLAGGLEPSGADGGGGRVGIGIVAAVGGVEHARERGEGEHHAGVGQGPRTVEGPGADVVDLAGDVGLARPGDELAEGDLRGLCALVVGDGAVEVEGQEAAVGGQGLGVGARGIAGEREWDGGHGNPPGKR